MKVPRIFWKVFEFYRHPIVRFYRWITRTSSKAIRKEIEEKIFGLVEKLGEITTQNTQFHNLRLAHIGMLTHITDPARRISLERTIDNMLMAENNNALMITEMKNNIQMLQMTVQSQEMNESVDMLTRMMDEHIINHRTVIDSQMTFATDSHEQIDVRRPFRDAMPGVSSNTDPTAGMPAPENPAVMVDPDPEPPRDIDVDDIEADPKVYDPVFDQQTKSEL